MKTYKVKRGQNIYDVALSVYGSIEGLFDLLVNNQELSFSTELKGGEELDYDEKSVVFQSVIDTFADDRITPANGERGVYYKDIEKKPRCVILVPEGETMISLDISGDGDMVVDWGDNTGLEPITLQPTSERHDHYFDCMVSGNRSVRLYGAFNIKTWDLSMVVGKIMPLSKIVVDEVICKENNISLTGLFLFEGTYMVKLEDMNVSSLEPIRDMSLSELRLSNIRYTNPSALDDYLIYLAKHNNERRSCEVTMDTLPSGVYQEPDKDENGNYVIETGMEAIYVITHEPAWNTAGKWKFDINGTIYTYQ